MANFEDIYAQRRAQQGGNPGGGVGAMNNAAQQAAYQQGQQQAQAEFQQPQQPPVPPGNAPYAEYASKMMLPTVLQAQSATGANQADAANPQSRARQLYASAIGQPSLTGFASGNGADPGSDQLLTTLLGRLFGGNPSNTQGPFSNAFTPQPSTAQPSSDPMMLQNPTGNPSVNRSGFPGGQQQQPTGNNNYYNNKYGR